MVVALCQIFKISPELERVLSPVAQLGIDLGSQRRARNEVLCLESIHRLIDEGQEIVVDVGGCHRYGARWRVWLPRLNKL